MEHKSHMTLLLVSMAACMAALFVLVATVAIHITNESDKLRTNQLAGCNRANVQRAKVNEIIRELGLKLEPVLIPVCEDIIG